MRIWHIVVALMVLSFRPALAASSTGLTLSYPAGGEVFVAGTTQQVRLGAKTKVTPVSVQLSTDGGMSFLTIGAIAVTKSGTPTLSFTVAARWPIC